MISRILILLYTVHHGLEYLYLIVWLIMVYYLTMRLLHFYGLVRIELQFL